MTTSNAGRQAPAFWRRCARGILVAAGFATAATLALPGTATAQTALRVGKSSAETFAFSPVHVGTELGIFAKHGLKISIIDFAGGSRLHQGLAAGAVDLGLGSGPEMASIVQGSPTKAVGMFMAPPAMLVLMVRADDSVKTLEDLKGRKVAVTQLNALTAWLVRRLGIGLNWGPKAFDIVAVGDDRTRLAALRTKQVDAIVINPATALQLEKLNQGRIIARFGKYVTHFHNHVMYATNDLIAKNPDAIRAFTKGWLETIQWMRANKEKAVEMTKGIQRVDTEIALRIYDEAMPAFSPDLRFSKQALDIIADSWVEMGILPKRPDIGTLYTEQFIP